MKNTLFKKGGTVALTLGLSILLVSCGGGGNTAGSIGGGNTAGSIGGGNTAGSIGGGNNGGSTGGVASGYGGGGEVGVYVQDSPSVPVGIGIYGISIVNTSDGNSCTLLSSSRPYFLNLANLNGIAKFLGIFNCTPDNYNQMSITLYPAISYMNPANSYTNTTASLTSIPLYYSGGTTTIDCISSSTCILTLNSNNSFSVDSNSSYIDLDFGFTIDGSGNFSFTVNPINGGGFQPNEPIDLSGTAVNVSNSVFTLVYSFGNLTVNYNGFPQLQTLLNSVLSSSSNLLYPVQVSVICPSITQQSGTETCTPSIIRETFEGTFNGYDSLTTSMTLAAPLSYVSLYPIPLTAGVFNLPYNYGSVTFPIFNNPVIYPPTMSLATFENDLNNLSSDWLYLVDSCNITSQTCTTTIYYAGQS